MSYEHGIKAKMIADSISPDGVRISTMEVNLHRLILPQFNTHRKTSKSSASLRAMPLELMLQRAMEHPALPVEWPCEQPGMSGGDLLSGSAFMDAEFLLREIREATTSLIQDYVDAHPDKSTRLHKSILNRPLEWFLWNKLVVTSTEWANLLRQRAHEDAQPEFRDLAYLMRDELEGSTPVELDWGQFHTPYLGINPGDDDLNVADGLQVSVARCARTSYLTHDGRRDQEDDLRLYQQTLAKKGHWAPLEHVCAPFQDTPGYPHRGNADLPWYQLRQFIEDGIALTDIPGVTS